MKLNLSRTLLIIGSIIATNAAFAADTAHLAGKYSCQGYDPTVTPASYSTKMTITYQPNGMFNTDEVDNLNNNYNGVAVYQNGILTIAFSQSNNDSKSFGIETFKVNTDDHSFAGTFSYWGIPNKLGTQNCQRI